MDCKTHLREQRQARAERARARRPGARAALAIAALTALQHAGARAHGSDPAQALSVVAADAQGASVVRLDEGLARRGPDGWRFVCPVLWGEDAVVPAQSIPGGPTLIGASTGLHVMREDGVVERHADPAAAGRVIALGTSAAGLFALRAEGAYEVLAVQADTVRVLWSDTRRWSDLAVADTFLSLMRVDEGQLFELRLSPAGAVLEQRAAMLPAGAGAVRARLLGDASYALVLSTSLRAELGRVEQGSWRSLQLAGAIAGPIQTADGQRLLALDGALARFDGEQLVPLPEPAGVTCLGRLSALDYACSEGDLRALGPAGLGAPLFALDELMEPDLSTVPEAAREACSLQWQRYEVDLLRLGIVPPYPDAGVDAGTADAAAHDAEVVPDAMEAVPVEALEPPAPVAATAHAAPIVTGTPAPMADEAPRAPEAPDVAGESGRGAAEDGCGLGHQPRSGWRWLAIIGWAWLRRARRPARLASPARRISQ